MGRHLSRSSLRARIFRFGLLVLVVVATLTGADLLRAHPVGEVVAAPTIYADAARAMPGLRSTSSPTPSPKPKPRPKPTPTVVHVAARAPIVRKPIPQPALVKAAVDAIGDSVMAGASKQLHQRISHLYLDAGISRQVSGGIAVLRHLHDAHKLADVVVIHLGTNGRFTSDQFEQIMRILSSVKKVVFVNIKVPRAWESSDNTVIAQGVRRHAGKAVLVDWHNRWRDCPGQVFWSDGYHLTSAGARCYAALVAAAI